MGEAGPSKKRPAASLNKAPSCSEAAQPDLFSLEAKVWGFDPAQFTDAVQELLTGQLEAGCDEAHEAFIQECGGRLSAATMQEVAQAVSVFRERGRRTIDQNVDKFEIYAARNIFGLPEGLISQIRRESIEAAGECGGGKKPRRSSSREAAGGDGVGDHESPPPREHVEEDASSAAGAARYTAEQEAQRDEQLAALRSALRKARANRMACAERLKECEAEVKRLEPISYNLGLARQELEAELPSSLQATLTQLATHEGQLRELSREGEELIRLLEERAGVSASSLTSAAASSASSPASSATAAAAAGGGSGGGGGDGVSRKRARPGTGGFTGEGEEKEGVDGDYQPGSRHLNHGNSAAGAVDRRPGKRPKEGQRDGAAEDDVSALPRPKADASDIKASIQELSQLRAKIRPPG